MKTKFIFDLDGTLLNSDFSCKNEYFKYALTKSNYETFVPQLDQLLNKYETKFKKYDVDILSEFLTYESQVKITSNMIREWLDFNEGTDTQIIDGAIETLEYLKIHNKQLVILTNFFRNSQLQRLKKNKLDTYFDEVFGGDSFLKPNKNAYVSACGYTPIELCIMIGDNYELDYLGAKTIGLDSILYDPQDKIPNAKTAVKNLRKIKEICNNR